MQKAIERAYQYGRITSAQYGAASQEFWRLWAAAGCPKED
jgi:hypothetical protein